MKTIAVAMLRHGAYLARLRERTGVTVSLAIEPEPACLLETVDDAVVFFREMLRSPPLLAEASAAEGFTMTVDEVTRHIGVCLDACHMAVEFEDPADAVSRLTREGIRIFKTQLSSALRLVRSPSDPPASSVLGRFAEDTYLHQVVTASAGGLVRYTDLPEALGAEDVTAGAEWRVHFHVPIFLHRMSGFETTQPYLASVLRVLQETSACRCLEVETYTWDVLPAEYRTSDVCTAIARELEWVRSQLIGDY